MALAGGFAASSVLIFAVVSVLGSWFFNASEHDDSALWIAAAVLVALVVLDGVRLMMGRQFGPGWKRQTPQAFMYRYGTSQAAVVWGLDTGLVVTTFRVTSLSWAALTVGFLGQTPWWIGVVYAAGFTVPLLGVILIRPRASRREDLDTGPVPLMNLLTRIRSGARIFGLLLLGLAAAVFTIAAWQ